MKRTATYRRLKAGAVVLKTTSHEAKHGAFWTYPDSGRLANANVCHRLERLGLLVSRDALIPDCGGQTYRYEPPTDAEIAEADPTRMEEVQ